MRRILSALLASATLFGVAGCKTTQQKREISNVSATDPYVIPDFNYKLNDIRSSGVTKEKLFAELDPDGIILNSSSICSNRALIWGWNMKRRYNVDSGKIFVFYARGFFTDPEYSSATGAPTDSGEVTEKQWWYHVAPYVVEDGKEWVLDHGFSPNAAGSRRNPETEIKTPWKGSITRPLAMSEWLLRFPKTTECKELTGDDKNYTDYMRRGAAFPHPRDGGAARCYYRKIPMTYWTPLSIAMHELKQTAKGEPLIQPFNRDTHFEGDIVRACEEAVSDDGILQVFGRGGKLKACLKFLGLDQPIPSYASLASFEPSDRKLQKRVDRALRQMGQ